MILDFSRLNYRYYGHDFRLQHKLDDHGYRWHLAVWHTPRPEIGDFILLGLNHNDIRIARIEKIDGCGNPNDMYFVDINLKNAKKLAKECGAIE